jgi:hypothetical protein
MNQFTTKLLGVTLLVTASMLVVHAQSEKNLSASAMPAVQRSHQKQNVANSLTEEFSFWIKDFKVDHQALTNNLNMAVTVRYVPNIANSEYPDFRLLTKDVESFLTNYPNEEDYWEIVNKKLTAEILNKYLVLTSVTIEIKLDPSAPSPYARSSRATRERRIVGSRRKGTY